MKEPLNDEVFDTLPKKPNFLLILILAGAAILIFFVAAYLFVSDTGKKLLPGLHPDPHPTSYLTLPASTTTDA